MRRVATQITPAQLRDLRRIVARQRKLLEPTRKPDAAKIVTAYFELDSAFHYTLSETAGNSEIVRAMQTQRDKLWRVISMLLHRDPEWILTTTVEHDAILDALERGDPAAADREMTAHLERGKEFLRQALVTDTPYGAH